MKTGKLHLCAQVDAAPPNVKIVAGNRIKLAQSLRFSARGKARFTVMVTAG